MHLIPASTRLNLLRACTSMPAAELPRSHFCAVLEVMAVTHSSAAVFQRADCFREQAKLLNAAIKRLNIYRRQGKKG